jgi:succinoglycan biosynthesis protein ExoA
MSGDVSIDLSHVLVVIPCLNEEAHLPGLLDQLIAHAGSATIVVADGGSRDRSRAIVEELAARHANVRLLDNPKRLQSAAVNLAARLFGQGRKWMVRIDAHCRYPDDYIAGLLTAAHRREATSVVVPMVTRGEACFQRAVAAAQNSVLGTGGSPHRHVGAGRFVDHGHHALFRLDLFLAVGGYDESFSHNEDAELDQRLLRAGGRLWLEPGQAIVYFPRRAPLPLFRQYHGYGSGRAKTLMRHRIAIKPRQAAPLAIAPALLLALLGVLALPSSSWTLLLVLPTAGWALGCIGFGAMLAIRTRSACALASGPAAMIMHAAWSAGFWRARLLGTPPGPSPDAIIMAMADRLS